MQTTESFTPGDVIEDFYGNPAVILTVASNGAPQTMMQTTGSDYGHRTYAPRVLRRITDEKRVEAAREVARSEWRKGRRW